MPTRLPLQKRDVTAVLVKPANGMAAMSMEWDIKKSSRAQAASPIDPELRAEANLKLGEIMQRMGRVTDALAAYRRAALFRVPQPAPAIRLTALSKAAELALEHRLLDSAARYIAMLRDLDPQNLKWTEMDQEIVALEASLLP